ncbi:MAG: gliding motility-associated protein GldE [Bacteroidota bacterium]|nr:gliding motility-associated protein GldE [Bacteroidota bacterium]MDP4212188.1 gliding motility-associated protein GldE [Bacteroidota bacterium]MDP4249062.1 gliding motility-associated protein GldE [Bacteroidota bacterium]
MDHPFNILAASGLPDFLLIINVQATTVLVILILFFLVMSFIVSGSRIAFFSLSDKEINILKTKQDSSWRRIVNLLEEPKALLASLLIANILLNIGIIILSNFLIDQVIPFKQDYWFFEFLIKVFMVSFVLILFGEVMPKVWASQNTLQFAFYTSGVTEVIHLLFKRLGILLANQSEKLERIFGSQRSAANSLEELDHAIDNDTTEEEKNILKGIIKFGQITVKQIMKTRLDVSGVEGSLNFGQLKRKVEELHYSRLPVYKKSLDEISGMIHTKDLIPFLNEPDVFDWHALLRAPYFVHEHKMIKDLMQEFQTDRIHFAVVVDEFGGTSGIVTLEDIMEEVIGDIKDEFDEDEGSSYKQEDGTFVFEGRTMMNDVCKAMNLPVNTFDQVKGDSDSLAGLILELAGEIPKLNDVITCGDFQFTILEADSSRIKKVKVSIK